MTEKEHIFYKIVEKDGRACMYIGQTTKWSERKSKHRAVGYLNKDTEMVEIYRKMCNNIEASCIEQAWINHFTPKWNRARAAHREKNVLLETQLDN